MSRLQINSLPPAPRRFVCAGAFGAVLALGSAVFVSAPAAAQPPAQDPPLPPSATPPDTRAEDGVRSAPLPPPDADTGDEAGREQRSARADPCGMTADEAERLDAEWAR